MKQTLEYGQRTDAIRKMRHTCIDRGCFEEKYRCALGKLDHLLPGKNAMTDVDAYCHINGHHLFLEWKTLNTPVPFPQRKALEALSHHNTVFVAWGNPKEMTPNRFEMLWQGTTVIKRAGPQAPRDFDKVIEAWGKYAQSYSRQQLPNDWWSGT